MILALVMAAAAAMVPPTCENGQPASANPDWVTMPTGDDIAWVYPQAARDEDLSGEALLDCQVNTEGFLEDCEVVRETPEDYGFGEAAVALTDAMRMRPRMECGHPVRGEVRIPIAFKIPPEAEVPELPSDPAMLALGRRLVTLSGVEYLIDEYFETGLQYSYGVSEDEGGLDIPHRKAAHEAAKETWRTVRESHLDLAAAAYVKRLGPEGLKEAIAFFETRAGRTMNLQSQEDIASSSGVIITPDLVDDFRRRYCGKVSPCEPVFEAVEAGGRKAAP